MSRRKKRKEVKWGESKHRKARVKRFKAKHPKSWEKRNDLGP